MGGESSAWVSTEGDELKRPNSPTAPPPMPIPLRSAPPPAGAWLPGLALPPLEIPARSASRAILLSSSWSLSSGAVEPSWRRPRDMLAPEDLRSPNLPRLTSPLETLRTGLVLVR